MDKNNKVCIIFPIGCSIESNVYEIASFINTCHILKNYDKYVVTTQSLNINYLQKIIDKENVYIKRLSNESFGSIGKYNHTFMQTKFYKDFSQYEYILIIHTNAWIFKDELLYWVNKGYDCISAPWCHFCKNVMKCNYIQDVQQNIIGNGGLSLRKIKKFIEVTTKIKQDKALDKYLIDNTPNEDIFLATYPGIEWNVPNCNEALHFSIEALALKHINSGIKPFGYHNLIKIHQIAMLKLHFDNLIKTIIENESN